MVLLILILIGLVCLKLVTGYQQFLFQQIWLPERLFFRLHQSNDLVVKLDYYTLSILSVIQIRVWQ